MTDMDRDHLIGNIVDHLGNAAKRIQMRQTALFYKAEPDYGRRVAAGLGLDITAVERLAVRSAAERAQATEPGTFSRTGSMDRGLGCSQRGGPGPKFAALPSFLPRA